MSVARCRLLLLLVLVVVVLTARGVGAEPSSHMEVARATSGAPLDPHATGTAIDLERSFRAAENQTRQLAVIDANLSAKTSALATLNQEILANQVHLGTVRDRIRSRAATLYQRGDSTSGALLDVGSVSDIKSAQQYAAAAMTIDTKQLAALTDTERDLEAQRSARTQEHDDLVDKQSRVSSSIADLQQRRDNTSAQLDDLRRRLNDEDRRLQELCVASDTPPPPAPGEPTQPSRGPASAPPNSGQRPITGPTRLPRQPANTAPRASSQP